MQNPNVQKEIERLCAQRTPSGEVVTGLRRIAFGSVADAMKLLFSPEGLDFDSLDLYCVSEIKVAKGGGMEIKFFDRIKALEKLSEQLGGGETGASAFVDALRKGAERLGEDL